MDMVEDLEEGEGDGDSVLEEALPPGLMLAWEEEDCPDVAISSAELRECLSHRVILLTATLGLRLIMEEWFIRELCHMVMLEHLWEQCQEPIPMLRR
jgi:hypothetical protein